jgi:iron complex outermembrane recepter protein
MTRHTVANRSCARSGATAVISSLITLLPAPLLAQEQGGGEGKLAEVVVTAQKKEESLQSAAVAVTAVSGSDIAASGIKDPIEIQNSLPAVTFQVANTPVMVIRGVGTYNNQPGVDSAVAYTVDGTYLSHHPALMPVLFDLERVEAVRGPQGTLYGRNSNGGALNITTARPVLGEFRASAAVTAGNYSAVGSELMLNAPIGDKSALRVALANDKHDAYFDDGSQGADNYAGRARWLFQPSDNFDVLATVDYAKKHHQGQGSSYCPPNSAYAACATVPNDPYAGYGGDQSHSHFNVKNSGAYAEMNLRTDPGVLTSITNYRDYEIDNTWVWDFVEYTPDNTNHFFTQEFRFASPSSSPQDLNWVVGAFYSHESLTAVEAYDFFDTPALRFRWTDASATSKAVFGQLTVPVSSTFRVIGGLRYTDERKTQFGSATTFDVTGTIPTTVATGGSNKEQRVTWKFGVDYDAAEDVLLYASASNGFKSGGVNQVPPGLGLTAVYNPEKITAFQAGMKSRFLNQRLQLNTEAFYYDYKGYQQYSQEADPSGFFPAVFFITVDSQNATFYGAELEATALVGSSGQFDLGVTALHARFDEFVVGSINNTGHEVQGAPDFSLNAGYQHTFDLASGSQVRARITSSYVDGHYVANNNARGSFQSAYTKTGVDVSFTSADRSWTVTAFGRNLEDEAVMASYADPISRGGDIGFLEAPRTYGLTVNWSLR